MKLSDDMQKCLDANTLTFPVEYWATEVRKLEVENTTLREDVARLHEFQHSDGDKRVSAKWWGRNIFDWIIDYSIKLEAVVEALRTRAGLDEALDALEDGDAE